MITTQHTRRITRRRLIGTALLLILAAGGIGLGFLANRAFTLRDVQAYLGAALPESASEVQFAAQRPFAKRIVWLRFTTSAEDAAAFLTAIGAADVRDGSTPFPQANPQEAGLTWWTPQAATVYSGSYTNTGTKIIEALLDRSGASVVVYLRVYTL
ncbi:MAG: hypothetical protein K8I60_03255 [Anaerolineae bacterium]|nr:hypothetical protein [Anaerolineae bacterium]